MNILDKMITKKALKVAEREGVLQKVLSMQSSETLQELLEAKLITINDFKKAKKKK